MSYVSFEIEEKKQKTSVYRVVSNEGTVLGRIFWKWTWRQYVFEPSSNTVWSRSCMREVQNFLRKLMNDRKKK